MAHVHRRRSGVRGRPVEAQPQALDAGAARRPRRRLSRGLEHRPLLDVQLEVGADRAESRSSASGAARELDAACSASDRGGTAVPSASRQARELARVEGAAERRAAEQAAAEAGALLVGEVDQDQVARRDPPAAASRRGARRARRGRRGRRRASRRRGRSRGGSRGRGPGAAVVARAAVAQRLPACVELDLRRRRGPSFAASQPRAAATPAPQADAPAPPSGPAGQIGSSSARSATHPARRRSPARPAASPSRLHFRPRRAPAAAPGRGSGRRRRRG